MKQCFTGLDYNWESKYWINTRSQWYVVTTGFSFVGAIQIFKTRIGDVPIFFANERVYTFIHKNSKAISADQMVADLRESIKHRDLSYPSNGLWKKDYVEIMAEDEWQDSVIDWLGVSKKEIEDRYLDIERMWETEEILFAHNPFELSLLLA